MYTRILGYTAVCILGYWDVILELQHVLHIKFPHNLLSLCRELFMKCYKLFIKIHKLHSNINTFRSNWLAVEVCKSPHSFMSYKGW